MLIEDYIYINGEDKMYYWKENDNWIILGFTLVCNA